MPITVRDKQYVLASGGSPDGVLEPQIEVSQRPAVVDIPKGTRVALAHWLSDITTGQVGYKANAKPITDETIVETQLSSQPITLVNQATITDIPRSTSGLQNEIVLNDDTLYHAPDSVAPYVTVTVAHNSASAAQLLHDTDLLIKNERFSNAKVFNVGPTLVARAAAQPGANIDDFDPQKPLSFNVEQLFAIRRSVSAVNAVSALKSAAATADVTGSAETSETWGQMNSPQSPYYSLNALALASIASAIVSAIITAASATAATLSSVSSTARVTAVDSTGRRPLGSSTNLSQAGVIARSLGIRQTKNNFITCVNVGLASFFGLTVSGIPNLSTLTSVIGGDAGFRVVIARAIIRSAVLSVAGLNDVAATLDINTIASRTRRLIGFVATFASLGDAILSVIDSSSENLSRQALMFAVPRVAAAGSLYQIPESLAREFTQVAGIGYSAVGSKTKTVIATSAERRSRGSRISTEDREAFERQLNAEYMPFYFHDLRTNEIISFHAFLGNLQETFSPKWESTEGFGRVDDVHTYKSTSRTISLNFTVVSTSPDDFDDMWVKINKLVTLVYPQFDSGRRVQSDSNGTDRFIQPFSQTFTASPIIRMRVGDVIKSNYSKFAIQRLFGYGEDDLKLSGKAINYSAPIDPATLTSLIKDTALQPNSGYTFYAGAGIYPAVASAAQLSIAPVFDSSSLNSQKSFVVNVVSVISEGVVACSVNVNSEEATAVSRDDVAKMTGKQSVVGGVYVIPTNCLRPTFQTMKKLERSLSLDQNDDGGSAEINNFFSEDNNAVIKSFKDVGGQGLAGKIDSLSINMLDKHLWEIDQDRRAPLGVTVDIGFTAIHDIAPGLDRFGVNRAPIYQIGNVR
jgi:hypothetical protein